ncbi:adenosylcobinamide-GDP ribazoletransferase [Flammeovirgaceae bacterium SG7u.111]|nr:adenosylcobinamide-GDP ribazoletransferase [Flammeovirgaceae bacterium SG7u.132]WPO34251.1 adenosylcobinamide-GDP ribazoletransferase [Flammeovirgaceae bacterium SG7u.111]
MKKEFHIFFTSLMFYTRIPVPSSWAGNDPSLLNAATRYFPLIGWIVGGVSAGVFYAFQLVLPLSVSILLSMIVSVLVTGAFHEDGFADVCDGFGGGWEKERILTIMKDSRIGAYGMIGTTLLLLLKYTVLVEIGDVSPGKLVLVLLLAHPISRLLAASFIFTHSYVREDELSKAKPIAKKLSWKNLLIALIFGLSPLLLFGDVLFALVLVPLLLMKGYLGWYFTKWIGGYTGDCLGATQQVSEVVCYLFCLAITVVK